MRYTIVHGADRLATRLHAAGEDPGSTRVPFHHVASRGVLAEAHRRELPASQWAQAAPLVDRALSGWRIADEQALRPWIGIARECGTLPYERSARSVLELVSRRGRDIYCELTGEGLDPERVLDWELWSVKEGHTSSVWKITAHGCAERLSFAVNVARDRAASDELMRMAQELEGLRARDPSRVVRILHCQVPRLEDGVCAVATTWIDRGLEINVLPSGRAVAVNRFVCGETLPGEIAAIAADPEHESDQLWEAMLRSWIALGDWSLVQGPVLLPDVEINEGDWVLQGEIAVLCALTPGPLELHPPDAVSRCVSMRARAGGVAIEWENRLRAMGILRELARAGSYPALTHWLEQSSD